MIGSANDDTVWKPGMKVFSECTIVRHTDLVTYLMSGRPSAGASLNGPPTKTIGPQFSGDLFFSRHLTEQQPSYICTRPNIFSIRNMRPLSIPEPPSPDRGGNGGLSAGSE